ncbi:acyl carrier protein [Amycolatopsis sp. WAC 04169]|uniref:acyl carrier protein n=1 Tax=Amycolatopsis sp. WAC 04169 TaxID=2203197 RepID=UPI0013155379|nr:acyl carrier protein [Amycolatopsis sp. WAC 04169]
MIADLLVKIAADVDIGHLSSDAIVNDEAIRHRDLADLGLGSLDWIKLAVMVANETGFELPDEALTNSGRRTIAGWSDALASASCHRRNWPDQRDRSSEREDAHAG